MRKAAIVVVPGPSSTVLAMYRHDPPQGWALPGGVVDGRETPEQAAVREVEEETGIRVSGLRPLLVMNGKDEVHFFYAERRESTRLEGSREGVPDWVSWSDLLSGPYGSEAGKVMERLVVRNLPF